MAFEAHPQSSHSFIALTVIAGAALRRTAVFEKDFVSPVNPDFTRTAVAMETQAGQPVHK